MVVCVCAYARARARLCVFVVEWDRVWSANACAMKAPEWQGIPGASASFPILVKTAPKEATVCAPVREPGVSHFHLQWMQFLLKVQLSARDPSPGTQPRNPTPSS